MLGIAIIGSGRIGRVHARSVVEHPQAKLTWLVDTDREVAEGLSSAFGESQPRVATDAAEALTDAATQAVIIATPTDTHRELVQQAAAAGKAILCEKPIALSLEDVDACRAAARIVPFMTGFNRRFDPGFGGIKRAINRGQLGHVEMVSITSRDLGPPSPEYMRTSGGLFRDMTIHDFDMAAWLLGDEIVSVHANASAQMELTRRCDDWDTAVVTLETQTGRMAVINNSRRAGYAYDQRVEVLGSLGVARSGDFLGSEDVTRGHSGDPACSSFDVLTDRYERAYRAEVDHFVSGVINETQLWPSFADCRRALELALAAEASAQTGRRIGV